MKRTIIMCLATVCMLAGCAAVSGPSAALDKTTTKSALSLVTPPATDKVLVIVGENHSWSQFQNDKDPYLAALGSTYAYATHMTACAHPSKPNYACYAAGSTMGLTSDSGKLVKGQSVFGATIKAGRTAKTMAESMGTDRCRLTDSSAKAGYVKKHVPPTFFVDERKSCESYTFDYGKYGAADIKNGKLANVEFLIPNQCNNAHNCSIETFEDWLKNVMTKIYAGPDWKSGRLTVVITTDEDDKKHGNNIPLVVMNKSLLLSHKVVTTPLTAYSLNRLLTDFGHVPHMRGGITAPDMAQAFGLNVG